MSIPGASAPGTAAPGQAEGDTNAAVSGFAITRNPAWVAGSGRAGQTAHGFDLSSSVVFAGGTATVSVQAEGFTLDATSSLIGGVASASVETSGFQLQAEPIFLGGDASSTGDVEGDGFDLTCSIEFDGGTAFGEKQPIIITGGSALAGRRRGDALAHGFALQARAIFSPGQARVGHEITYIDADGSECFHTIYGVPPDILTDTVFMQGLMTGDHALCAVALEERRERELETV